MKTGFISFALFAMDILCMVMAFIHVFFIEPLFYFRKEKGMKSMMGRVTTQACESKAWMLTWINLHQLFS